MAGEDSLRIFTHPWLFATCNRHLKIAVLSPVMAASSSSSSRNSSSSGTWGAGQQRRQGASDHDPVSEGRS